MGFFDSFRAPDVDDLAARHDIPGLTKATHHKKWDVRLKAVVALGKVGDATVLPALLLSLRDEVAEVRREAATALAVVGDHRALHPLAALLKDEDRLAASWAQEFFASATVIGAGSRASSEFIAGVHRQRGVRQAALDALAEVEERLPRAETVRIAADPNHRSEDDLLRLDRSTSVTDIERSGDLLTPGLRVTFYGENYEMEGVLVFDEPHRTWLGIPKWESWRDR